MKLPRLTSGPTEAEKKPEKTGPGFARRYWKPIGGGVLAVAIAVAGLTTYENAQPEPDAQSTTILRPTECTNGQESIPTILTVPDGSSVPQQMSDEDEPYAYLVPAAGKVSLQPAEGRGDDIIIKPSGEGVDLTYQYDGYTFTVLSDTAQIDQPGVGIVAATTVQAFQDCDRTED